MYNLNPLMRNVLITSNEVIFHAPTKHTLDPRTIEQSIIIAEERFIRPELGDLYDAICTEKNLVITSANLADYSNKFSNHTLQVGDTINAFELLSAYNLELWKRYLWKLVAECVMVIAFPEAWVQFASQGVMHTVAPMSPMGGAGDVSPDLRSVKWMLDKKMMDRIGPLISAMHTYICRTKKANQLAFTAYTRDCPCDEKTADKRTDLLLGLYDDVDNVYDRCGCGTPAQRNDPYYPNSEEWY